MTHEEIIEAIKHLAPQAEWTLSGNDYNDIVWLSDSSKPSLTEIEAEIALIPIRKEQAKAAKEHERAALLERLGITEEEARLLLGGN